MGEIFSKLEGIFQGISVFYFNNFLKFKHSLWSIQNICACVRDIYLYVISVTWRERKKVLLNFYVVILSIIQLATVGMHRVCVCMCCTGDWTQRLTNLKQVRTAQPHTHPFLFYFETGHTKVLMPASNFPSSCRSFPSSWDYRCVLQRSNHVKIFKIQTFYKIKQTNPGILLLYFVKQERRPVFIVMVSAFCVMALKIQI